MASAELAAALGTVQSVAHTYALPPAAPATSAMASVPSLVSDASCSYFPASYHPSSIDLSAPRSSQASIATLLSTRRSSSLQSQGLPSRRKLSGMMLDTLPKASIDDLSARFHPLVLSPPAEEADWTHVAPCLQPIADTLRSPTLRFELGQPLAGPLLRLLRLSADTSPPPRDAQTQIARALGNLCVNCPENRDRLFEHSVAEPLLDLALSALGDAEPDLRLVRATLGALYNTQLDHTCTHQSLRHHPTALATLFHLVADSRVFALSEAYTTTWKLIQDIVLPSEEEEERPPSSASSRSDPSLPAGSDPDAEEATTGGLPSSFDGEEDPFLPPLAVNPAIEATTMVLRAFLCSEGDPEVLSIATDLLEMGALECHSWRCAAAQPQHFPVYMAFLHFPFDPTAAQAVQRSVIAISQDDGAVDVLLANGRWWTTTLVENLHDPLVFVLLGNTIHTPGHCIALVRPGLPQLLSPIFARAWRDGNIALVASLLGVIKNLATPLETRAVLGTAGWIEHAFSLLSLLPSEGLGVVELLFRALTVVRLLSLGAVGNAVRATSYVTALTTLALEGAVSLPIRQEAARVLAYVVQTLFLFPLPAASREGPDANGHLRNETEETKQTFCAIYRAREDLTNEPVVSALTSLLSAHEQLANEALTALRVLTPRNAPLIARLLHTLPPILLGPPLGVYNTLLLLHALAQEGELGPVRSLRAHLSLLAESGSASSTLARSLLHYLHLQPHA